MFSLLLCAASPRVHVEGGAYTEQLSLALAEEPNLIVSTASAAEMYVRLLPASEGLVLTVRGATGAVALERKIDLQRGLDPALRMAVLLVRGALEPLPEPPKIVKTEKPAPVLLARVAPVPTATPGWTMKASASAMSDVVHAELGVAIAAHLRFARFAAGAAFMYGTWFAGTDTSSVENEVSELMFVADLAFLLIDNDALALSIFGSFGALNRRVEARGGDAFEGEGTPLFVRPWSPVGFAGGELRVPFLDGLALELRAGLKVSAPLEVVLPRAFDPRDPEEPFVASRFAPFASAGLSLEIF
jgi:hypothetical protein